MSLFKIYYTRATKIALVSLLTILLSHCASSKHMRADESVEEAKPRKEGGIVGTGNTQGCKDKKDKSQCSETVK